MKEKYYLSYSQQAVGEPLVYTIIKRFDVKVNILRAEVTPGQEGRLLLELEGSEEAIGQAMIYLDGQEVTCLPSSRAILWRQDDCVDCGACTGVCFSGALALDPPSAKLELKRELCIGCGLCVKACPFGLFSLAFDEA
jgi:L-aspartate semialdehyde sulfurtransferase ferredoxin